MQKKESNIILLILMTSVISIGLLLGNGKFALAEDKELPRGISKKEQIPGKGSHKGWEQGEHKGWDKDKNSDKIQNEDSDKDKNKSKDKDKDKNNLEEKSGKKIEKDKKTEKERIRELKQERDRQKKHSAHGVINVKGNKRK